MQSHKRKTPDNSDDNRSNNDYEIFTNKVLFDKLFGTSIDALFEKDQKIIDDILAKKTPNLDVNQNLSKEASSSCEATSGSNQSSSSTSQKQTEDEQKTDNDNDNSFITPKSPADGFFTRMLFDFFLMPRALDIMLPPSEEKNNKKATTTKPTSNTLFKSATQSSSCSGSHSVFAHKAPDSIIREGGTKTALPNSSTNSR